MTVRRLTKSWQYDFKTPGSKKRHRQAGYRTKAEALAAEKRAREEVISGHRRILFSDAYEAYKKGTRIQERTLDSMESIWRDIYPVLGHLYIEEVDTSALDALKLSLPKRLGAKSINNRLALVKAVLRFMWKRQKLAAVPYVPMESEPKGTVEWYSEEERDRFLVGMFEMFPEWYLFFFISMRLGLRLGEVYALAHSRMRDIPPALVIDRSVQRGFKDRKAKLKTRKNNEAYTLQLTEDIVSAIRWHVREGYSGEEFFFSKDGEFSKSLDKHNWPRKAVQRALGLRMLSHHKLGRHSVGSQAANAGHSMKAIQAQLGHRSPQSTHIYAHASNRAKLRLVQALAPAAPPHVNHRSTSGE